MDFLYCSCRLSGEKCKGNNTRGAKATKANKRVLNSREIIRVKNVTIKSVKPEFMTLEQNKVALSAYCDKRFYLDPINSLSFGHKNIREFAFHNFILNDWDWESENESHLDSISQPTQECDI